MSAEVSNADLHTGFVAQAPGAAGLHEQWYQANLDAGCVTAQQCACGRWRMPARYRCASCHGDAWAFAAVTQRGVVRGWTVTHRPFHFGYVDAVPYGLLIVEVPERVRYLLHARPRLSALAAPTIGDSMVGAEVALGIDAFGLPYAAVSDLARDVSSACDVG